MKFVSMCVTRTDNLHKGMQFLSSDVSLVLEARMEVYKSNTFKKCWFVTLRISVVKVSFCNWANQHLRSDLISKS